MVSSQNISRMISLGISSLEDARALLDKKEYAQIRDETREEFKTQLFLFINDLRLVLRSENTLGALEQLGQVYDELDAHIRQFGVNMRIKSGYRPLNLTAQDSADLIYHLKTAERPLKLAWDLLSADMGVSAR